MFLEKYQMFKTSKVICTFLRVQVSPLICLNPSILKLKLYFFIHTIFMSCLLSTSDLVTDSKSENMRNSSKFIGLIIYLAIIQSISTSCSKSPATFIDETIHIRNKGADMPAYVHGSAESQTFLIVLHGAGSYGLSFRDGAFTSQLEEKYVVVYFDQRGQSMSEGHYNKPENLLNLMVEDVQALTQVIKKRYGSEINLFILGHSWGGLLSAATILKDDFQDNFKGWINVDGLLDVPSQNEARKELIISIADENQNQSDHSDHWKQLKSEAMETQDYEEILSLAQRTLGLLRKDRMVSESISTSKFYQAIVTNNPINYLVSNFFNKPINSVLESDYSLIPEISRIQIPTLFIYGKYDVSVPPETGLAAFSKIDLEEKEIIIFDKSIHHPHDSEPEKFGMTIIKFIERYN